MSEEIYLARSYYDALLDSQYLDQDELAQYQSRLLGPLYQHALRNVAFYQSHSQIDGPLDSHSTQWLSLPFISRRDIAESPDRFRASRLPAEHGDVVRVQSGGSTGHPIHLDLSRLEKFARSVLTYRMFMQWDLDPGLPLFMIRKPHAGLAPKPGIGFRKWAYPWFDEAKLGDRLHLDITLPAEQQLEHLADCGPFYANTLPSNILRLAHAADKLGVKLDIPLIISVAEYLPPEVKATAKHVFGSRTINVLSSSEAGVIALECPHSGLLHIQSEAVLAEIINTAGEPCKEGEAGELVVTALYNYAYPLIRYRSGDFVVKGPQCPCGVRLPTISKILGRREHMFKFAGGDPVLPAIDRVKITALLDSESWQLVQVASGGVEFRHIETEALPAEKWRQIRALIFDALPQTVQVSEVSATELPLTSGAKRHFCVNEIRDG